MKTPGKKSAPPKKARGALKDPAATVKRPGKPGKPAHVPTEESRARVRLLAGLGFNQEEIALLLDLGASALVRHYAYELRVGGLEADEKVLGGLFKGATNWDSPEVAARLSMFWTKVRRRWHEVQRVIHGYDPETIRTFVKSVVQLLRRELPEKCPGCQTALHLGPKIATQLLQLSQDMATKLPQSEIVPRPVPELASDGLED